MRADTLHALREELGSEPSTGLTSGRNTVQFGSRLAAIERVLEVGLWSRSRPCAASNTMRRYVCCISDESDHDHLSVA